MSLECSKCAAPMQYGGTPCRWFCPTCEAPCERCGRPGAGPCLTDGEDGRDLGLPVKILCVACARATEHCECAAPMTDLWRKMKTLTCGCAETPDGATYRTPPRSDADLLREENEALREKNRALRNAQFFWMAMALIHTALAVWRLFYGMAW